MVELLALGILMVAAIVAAQVIGPRLGIAAPVLLVVVGIAASLAPALPNVAVDPQVILEGILPPLLYASAVSMPAMNFRREFGAISGLSVVLVLVSSLVLGAYFARVVPGIGMAWGMALGAVVSPIDAVATAIVKQTSRSRRAVAMLDGESLLNDATALVVLRTSAVAAAGSFSFWRGVGTFAWSVAAAVAVGAAAGWACLLLRRRFREPTVTALVSFATPFLASIPAELLGASGLVSAVVAGIVTGVWAPRLLPPQHRVAEQQNWNTVQLALEGLVFLLMGLELSAILADARGDWEVVRRAALIALGALGLVLAVRALYMDVLRRRLAARIRRRERRAHRLRVGQDGGRRGGRAGRSRRLTSEQRLRLLARRLTRAIADLDYFETEPFGTRESLLVVWAGMRGAVTIAAAQTLPAGAPERPLLICIAFAVATLSLLVQGSTIAPLSRRLGPSPAEQLRQQDRERRDRARIAQILEDARRRAERASQTGAQAGGSGGARKLAALEAQRVALLDARDNGTFDAELLQQALATLDALQIALELREGREA